MSRLFIIISVVLLLLTSCGNGKSYQPIMLAEKGFEELIKCEKILNAKTFEPIGYIKTHRWHSGEFQKYEDLYYVEDLNQVKIGIIKSDGATYRFKRDGSRELVGFFTVVNGAKTLLDFAGEVSREEVDSVYFKSKQH